jgi:hypothetical protein
MPLPNAFKPTPVAQMQTAQPAAAGGGAGGLSTPVWLGIVAVLLAAVGGLLVLVLRGQQRGRGAAGAVVLLLASHSAWADQLPQPVSHEEAATAWATREAEINSAQIEADATNRATAERTFGQISGMYGLATTAREFGEAWQAVGSVCAPDYSPAGLPQVPSACAGNSACTECYAEAQEKLGNTRRVLEKLRCMGSNTKAMTDKSIALGDATSGAVPGSVAGLAWIKEKKMIQDDFKNFEQAYDRKHRELMNSLRTDLEAIAQCEAGLGVDDWYNRYGFIYYQFMEDHYKRKW